MLQVEEAKAAAPKRSGFDGSSASPADLLQELLSRDKA